MATRKRNSAGQDYTNNSDGFVLGGGTTQRDLTLSGGNVTISASGSATTIFPSTGGTLVTQVDLATKQNRRIITITSGSATMGSTALTDYAYFVSGAHTMSLPSAVGNTNRYTVKNNHSVNITIDTAGAELIEGAASISIAPEESVDILSNATNWYVV